MPLSQLPLPSVSTLKFVHGANGGGGEGGGGEGGGGEGGWLGGGSSGFGGWLGGGGAGGGGDGGGGDGLTESWQMAFVGTPSAPLYPTLVL